MPIICDNRAKAGPVIYSSIVVSVTVCLSYLIGNASAFNILTPYVSRRGGGGGSFANHHPLPYVTSNNHHTTFIGHSPFFPIVSSGGGPFLRPRPFAPNNGTAAGAVASIVPWWHPQQDVTSINVGGVKIDIETKVNGKPVSSSVAVVSPAAESSGSEGQCCPTCGSLYTSGRSDLWRFYPSSRVPVTVWPESTFQYRHFDVFVEERGSLNAPNYEIYFRNENGPISPFHDIPLFANEGNKIFNMVVEVPRWTNAKMEIATKDPLNPIKQDVKKGKLRYVANVFPHHGYIWNYGALPQTWEDPSHQDEATGCKGDNDPIDVCEIGYRVAKRGEVIQVKILGTIALIDEGETDWKLIAIDVNDPLAPQLSDISDVEQHMPGFLKATVEWFKIYKIPDGKPENQFAFDGMAKDREFAHKIIMETHEAWQNLVEGTADAGGLDNTCVLIPNAANKMNTDEAEQVVNQAAEPASATPVDPKVDLWHYVSLK
ncbi:uncharacterized protein Nurf-38 isoform X1 [Macrobrachium rosenbergii]|uniref:uncharacterized protein Nurf-38 isoform X1 n=1 Tax=Macrobrachium rosenbergii TaxID=79674 RepID=UPI0034D78129